MRELQRANELFNIINSKQIDIQKPLKLSKYTLMVPCDEGLLLFSNLTCQLLYLSVEESNCLDLIKHYKSGNKIIENIRNSDKQLINELIKQRFIIPESFDEKKLADQAMQLAQLMSKKKESIREFTVFTTTDCNARCYYCYEIGKKRATMKEDTAKDVADYIYKVSGGETVNIWWFGGEPLLNISAIDIITEELRSKGVCFTSKMVSNAYLFTEDVVKRATNNWNLVFVQVPLDGREEIYNRNKAYIDSNGSAYQKVMHNISSLIDNDIKVSARLNIDNKNSDEIDLLADELIERFANSNNFEAYAAILKDYGHKINEFSSDDEALAVYEKLQNKLISGGIGLVRYPKSKIAIYMCMADNDNAVTILPDGKLGKCQHKVDTDTIGSIYDPDLDIERIKEWKEKISNSECNDCLFYPYCIRLKKCPWNYGECTEYNRKLMTINLTQKIKNVYKRCRTDGTL